MYKDITDFNINSTDIKAINQSIKNILLTPIGSLPGKPSFGSNLYKIVFAQLDSLTEEMAKNYIYEALRKYETRILVKEINFKRIDEYNKLVIDIVYYYRDEDLLTNESSTSVSFSL